VSSLGDDVTSRVAVHDEPLRGKDTAGLLFGVLTRELAAFELADRIVWVSGRPDRGQPVARSAEYNGR
jgi:hypothetical protein